MYAIKMPYKRKIKLKTNCATAITKIYWPTNINIMYIFIYKYVFLLLLLILLQLFWIQLKSS